jgi:hypothetical protein
MADETTQNEQAPPQPKPTALAPNEAADLMSATVQNLRQQWLQSAVTISNLLKKGNTVQRGTFEDLKRMRENYEELERARIVLLKLGTTGGADTGTTDKV